MPNISKKTAYDVKEASNQSLSAGARKHYAENAQAGFKSDSGHGSFMSKHSQSRMGGSPLHQAEDEPKQTTIYPDRKNKKGQTQEQVFNLRNKQVGKAADNYNSKANHITEPGLKKKYNIAVKNQKGTVDSLNTANKRMDRLFSGISTKRTKLNKQQDDILSGKY